MTETEKGAKIARFFLPSTTMFSCFNRPETKIKRCVFTVFLFFSEFFLAVEQSMSEQRNHLNVERCKR